MPSTPPFLRHGWLVAAALAFTLTLTACGTESPEPAAPVGAESSTTTRLPASTSSTTSVPTSTSGPEIIPTTSTLPPPAAPTTSTVSTEPAATALTEVNDALDALDELLAGLGDQVDGLADDLAADADAQNTTG